MQMVEKSDAVINNSKSSSLVSRYSLGLSEAIDDWFIGQILNLKLNTIKRLLYDITAFFTYLKQRVYMVLRVAKLFRMFLASPQRVA